MSITGIFTALWLQLRLRLLLWFRLCRKQLRACERPSIVWLEKHFFPCFFNTLAELRHVKSFCCLCARLLALRHAEGLSLLLWLVFSACNGLYFLFYFILFHLHRNKPPPQKNAPPFQKYTTFFSMHPTPESCVPWFPLLPLVTSHISHD